MRQLPFLCLLLVLGLVGPLGAQPKRLVLVDDCNSGFTNNHEGYERALDVPRGWQKEVHVGGDLTRLLGRLNSGDELVLVAHGVGGGTGFIWGTDRAGQPMIYTGFGPGRGTLPLPAGFGMLRNIRVRFCTCWSTDDPDGNGPDLPLARKLLDALGGAGRGHRIAGYDDFAFAAVCYRILNATMAEIRTAARCLAADPSWMENPPSNRPRPGGATQQTAAQMVLAGCRGLNPRVRVVIPDAVAGRNQGGYKRPVNRLRLPPPGQGATGGCCGPEGCGIGGQEPVLPECWLLVGAHSAAIPLNGEDTLWLVPDPTLAWPVTMEDIPTFFVPQDPSLVGLTAHAQVVMVNPELFPNDPVQTSNGLEITIGGACRSYGTDTGILLWEVSPAALGGHVELAFSVLAL